MKLSKLMLVVAVATLTSIATSVYGKSKIVPRIYMFGFAASFSDSTVYFTNVQAVDNVWMDSKTKFLLGRDNYSLQLKHMLAQKMNQPNRTCIVAFGKKRKDVENKLLKMKKLYTNKKAKTQYDVRYIPENEFRFQAINMDFEESANNSQAPNVTDKQSKKKQKRR